MSTLIELHQVIVRRSSKKFRGRYYVVSLLPGDIIEFRGQWQRKSFGSPLEDIFEQLIIRDKRKSYEPAKTEANMTYRVYLQWPGQKVTNKTVTESRKVAETAYQELIESLQFKEQGALGVSFTEDTNQIGYHKFNEKGHGHK